MSLPALLTALVAFILLLSAIGKGMDFFRAERDIEMFILLWAERESFFITFLARLVTITAILAEIFSAFMLVLSPHRKRTKLFTVTLLTTFFTTTTLTLIVHRPSVLCPCFGVLGKLPLELTSFLDLSMLLIVIYFISPKPLVMLSQTTKIKMISGVFVALFIINLPFISPTPTVSRGKNFFQKGINEHLPLHFEDGLIWFFHPRCPHCLESYQVFELANFQLKSGKGLLALTTASIGEINEFKIDYSPPFPILSVSSQAWEKWKVPIGSWVEVHKGKVIRLVRSYEILSYLNDQRP